MEWIWNRHFAAVAGDAVAWECWPSKDGEWRLHDWLLGLL